MQQNISLEPIILFDQWYHDAIEGSSVKEPNFMVLSTASKDAKPSSRVVLLKKYNDEGFYFFTNLTSRKGKEIHENPHASLCFYWPNCDRQVRIEGILSQISNKEADDYFASRSRGSQIGAWSSKQSMPMSDTEDLPNRVKLITEQFKDQDIPRPPFWSGFCLKPEAIEFWEAAEYRLHKRVAYKFINGKWLSERLYP